MNRPHVHNFEENGSQTSFRANSGVRPTPLIQNDTSSRGTRIGARTGGRWYALRHSSPGFGVEWFDDLFIAAAERQPVAFERVEVGEVVGLQRLTLDDREVDLGLVEPTRMHGRVDDGQVRRGSPEAVDRVRRGTLGTSWPINTQIRRITRRAYGVHSPAALVALAMLSLAGSARRFQGEATVTDPRERQETQNF